MGKGRGKREEGKGKRGMGKGEGQGQSQCKSQGKVERQEPRAKLQRPPTPNAEKYIKTHDFRSVAQGKRARG